MKLDFFLLIGPTEIDWKTNPDDPGLQEGMILSNGMHNIFSYVLKKMEFF